MLQIHVIIAVHNRILITREFINRLKEQTYKNIHLIVVDDGSTDGTYEMVNSIDINKTIIHGNGNLWWGGAMHQAYLWLKNNFCDMEEFVMMANDDIIIDNDFIEKGVKLLSGLGNTLLTANGYGVHSGEKMDGAIVYRFWDGITRIADAGEEGNCASTHALFLRVKDFMKIGGFHPVLLPHYGSDYEFTIRAWRKGFHIISSPELNYYFNEETTGNLHYLNLNPTSLVRKIFSKKSVYNPVYKITFILLACPAKYVLPNMLFQVIRYFRNVVLYIKRHMSNKTMR